MKKRIIALISLIILTSIVATACTQSGNSTTGSAESTSSTLESASTSTAEERKMEGNMYLEGLPIVKETETISILSDGNPPGEERILVPMIEENTNIKIEWLLYPYDVALEKKILLINSGDYPDVIGGWLLSQNEIINDGMGDGLYVPIDESIKKYAPNMSNILDIKGVRETMTLPDGHIYTIPYVLDAPAVSFNPYINQKWLDAVKMKMPTTTDELIEVLRAFKDQDPNGNNKKDEIAFSGAPISTYLGIFAGWFGLPCPSGNFTMVDGKLTFAANTDNFKSAIKFFNQLNDEGLLDPEFFTQDNAQWTAKGNQNLYGVNFAYASVDFVSGLSIGDHTDFVPLPVLKGPNVNKPVWQRDTYGNSVLRTQAAVTDKADNLATIIRWFDYIFSEEISIQLYNGPLGKTIEKIGDKQYREFDRSKMSDEDNKKYEWNNLFPQSLPKFISPDVKVLPTAGAPEKWLEKPIVDSLYGPYLNERTPSVWTSEEDTKRISILETDINKYITEKIAMWVSGQSDIDAEWDTYKAQLEKIGLNELIQIKTKYIK